MHTKIYSTTLKNIHVMSVLLVVVGGMSVAIVVFLERGQGSRATLKIGRQILLHPVDLNNVQR